jgi:hypothetical protein
MSDRKFSHTIRAAIQNDAAGSSTRDYTTKCATRRADAHLFLRGTNMRKLTFILTACLLITGISLAQTYVPPPSSGSSIQ